MFALLAIEWLKIRRYRTFWFLMALFIGLFFLTNFLVSHRFFIQTDVNLHLFFGNYAFPEVWDNVGFLVRLLGGIIPVAIIISTTNEYQFRTHRQNVIDGWSRSDYLHAKWLLCLGVAAFITLLCGMLGLSFGFAYSRNFMAAGQHVERLGWIFLLVLNYTAFAMTLSFFLKRAAVTIILFVSFSYIIEFVLAKVVTHYAGHALGDYLPLQCSANLLGFPFAEPIKEQLQQQIKAAAGPSASWLALASGGWMAGYYLIGRWKLQRSDW